MSYTGKDMFLVSSTWTLTLYSIRAPTYYPDCMFEYSETPVNLYTKSTFIQCFPLLIKKRFPIRLSNRIPDRVSRHNGGSIIEYLIIDHLSYNLFLNASSKYGVECLLETNPWIPIFLFFVTIVVLNPRMDFHHYRYEINVRTNHNHINLRVRLT